MTEQMLKDCVRLMRGEMSVEELIAEILCVLRELSVSFLMNGLSQQRRQGTVNTVHATPVS